MNTRQKPKVYETNENLLFFHFFLLVHRQSSSHIKNSVMDRSRTNNFTELVHDGTTTPTLIWSKGSLYFIIHRMIQMNNCKVLVIHWLLVLVFLVIAVCEGDPVVSVTKSPSSEACDRFPLFSFTCSPKHIEEACDLRFVGWNRDGVYLSSHFFIFLLTHHSPSHEMNLYYFLLQLQSNYNGDRYMLEQISESGNTLLHTHSVYLVHDESHVVNLGSVVRLVCDRLLFSQLLYQSLHFCMCLLYHSSHTSSINIYMHVCCWFSDSLMGSFIWSCIATIFQCLSIFHLITRVMWAMLRLW